MSIIFLTPPIVFIIFLAISLGMSRLSAVFTAKGIDTPDKTRSYACGEKTFRNNGKPEYKQFFEFAFFFTIMHVVVLIIATVPSGISAMSVIYLAAAVLALFILFRR